VPEREWQELGDTVYALARDSILIQDRLDAAAAADETRFAALLASVPEPSRPLLMPLAPSRLQLTEHHVQCTLRIASSRSLSFSLAVRPLNLGFSVLYGKSAAEESSLSIAVRSVPLATPRTY
jgi:hypothetical protein